MPAGTRAQALQKVVAGGGEHGVDGVAASMGKVISAHAGAFGFMCRKRKPDDEAARVLK